MTDTLKNKLKSLTKDLISKLEAYEDYATYMQKGFKELFEEEDVKDLPSYDLLKSVYGEYLTAKPERARTIEQKQEEIYDPLYAPPKTRKRVGARLKKQMAETSYGTEVPKNSQTQEVKQNQEHVVRNAPSNMPDFGSSLLEGMDKRSTAPTPKIVHKPKNQTQTCMVKVDQGDTVYTVEIKGKQYIRNGKYLYDKVNMLRIGSIENGVFVINGENHIAFNNNNNIELKPIKDTKYFVANNGGVFIRIADESDVYQAIGEMTNGEIGFYEQPIN